MFGISQQNKRDRDTPTVDATVGRIMRMGGYGVVVMGFALTVLGFSSEAGMFRMPDYSGGVFRAEQDRENRVEQEQGKSRFGWGMAVGLPLMGAGVLMLRRGGMREAMARTRQRIDEQQANQRMVSEQIQRTMDQAVTREQAAGKMVMIDTQTMNAHTGGNATMQPASKDDVLVIVGEDGTDVRCGSCGVINTSRAKYCDQCGKRLA